MILIIWYNPHNNTFYHRVYRTLNIDFYPGYVNQYDHKIIYILDLPKEIYYKPTPIKRFVKKLIRILNKIDKKL